MKNYLKIRNLKCIVALGFFGALVWLSILLTKSGCENGDTMNFNLMCNSSVVLVPDCVQRLPDIIIIGAKKCGTRALIDFLKLHPYLKSAGPEIHFFDKHYAKGLKWYKSKVALLYFDTMTKC